MIGGILNFISFCVDSMGSVLNEKLYSVLKEGTSFQSSRKHLRSTVTPNNCLKPYSPLTFQTENTSLIM